MTVEEKLDTLTLLIKELKITVMELKQIVNNISDKLPKVG